MNVSNDVGAAMAASASENGCPRHPAPRPARLAGLRTRALDGSYPFRTHPTIAEQWGAAA